MSIPERDHTLPLAEAAEMTRRYRLKNPKGEKAGTFHADQVRALLAQPGCAYFRYYHALDAEGRYAIILVAVDHAGRDVTDGIVMEKHFPCPPICEGVSDLATSAWVARARTMGSQRLIPA